MRVQKRAVAAAACTKYLTKEYQEAIKNRTKLELQSFANYEDAAVIWPSVVPNERETEPDMVVFTVKATLSVPCTADAGEVEEARKADLA